MHFPIWSLVLNRSKYCHLSLTKHNQIKPYRIQNTTEKHFNKRSFVTVSTDDKQELIQSGQSVNCHYRRCQISKLLFKFKTRFFVQWTVTIAFSRYMIGHMSQSVFKKTFDNVANLVP